MTNADKKERRERDAFAKAADVVAGDMLVDRGTAFAQLFTQNVEDQLGRRLTDSEDVELNMYFAIICDIRSAAKDAEQKAREEQYARTWAEAIEQLRQRKCIAAKVRFHPAIRPRWTVCYVEILKVDEWCGGTPMIDAGAGAVTLAEYDEWAEDVTAEILAAVDAANAAPEPARGTLLVALRHQYDLDNPNAGAV